MNKTNKSIPHLIRCAIALSAIGTQSASAAEGTWTGATNNVWDTTATNWSGVSGAPWDATNGPTNIATFTPPSGTTTVSGGVFVNQINYSGGNYVINGSGTLNLAGTTPTVTVGSSSSLTFATGVLGGSQGLTTSGAGTLLLYGPNTYSGNTVISTGTLRLGNATGLGATGSGNTTTISSGAQLELANNITVAGENLTLNGSSTLSNQSGTNTWNGNITVAGASSRIRNSASDLGTLTIGGNIATGGNTPIFDGTGNTIYTGTISGSGGVLRGSIGTGIVTLNGNNTYTGATSVLNGTLLVNGSHTGAAAYSVSSGATLGGTGSITTAADASVTLANGASLSPGDNSASDLTFSLGTGSLDLSAMTTASKLLFTLGTSSDKITITTGTLNIGTLNSGEFSFTQGAGFTNGIYTLFDTNSSISSTALDTNSFSLGGGYFGTLQFANGNQDIHLSVIPEPSTTGGLMGAGVALMAMLRRRRRC